MSNLRAGPALQRARSVFLQRPSAAVGPDAPATARLGEGLRCEVAGPDGQRAETDLPSAIGGDGSGPTPGWLFRASIASCTATAIAMRAALHGIPIDSLEVRVESESDARGLVGIDGPSTAMRALRLSIRMSAAAADAGRLREIAQWAAADSPTNRTLRANPSVAIDIDVG